MKLNIIALSSVLAVALAQESSTTTAAPTATLTAQERCAKQCDAADVCCKAQCFAVPCPSDQQANDTISCVADCPQGNGSPSDTEAYAQCQARCYSTHFFPATVTVTDAPSSTNSGSSSDTTTGDSSSESGSDDSSSGTTGSGSGSGTPTGGSAPTETPNMAAAVTQLKVGVSAAGLAGFLLAAWAL